MTNLNDALASITLDPDLDESLSNQLTNALRQAILGDSACSGQRLPSSRSFAEELGVSRITVLHAIDQLASEGYVEGRRGAGVYVADELGDPSLLLHRNVGNREQATHETIGVKSEDDQPIRAFQPALPDMRAFPHRAWSRLLERYWSAPSQALLHTIEPLGHLPLRSAVAEHLSAWRGIECSANDVIITAGSTDAMRLVLEALTSLKGAIAVEDPGYSGLWRAAKLAGKAILPITVDAQGMNVEGLIASRQKIDAVITTPGRQYPLGPTLPLSRRLELLNWAARRKVVVVEDDYDSEFRYRGSPLPSLCSLDTVDTAIYLGSFSKLFAPGLRLGFLVAKGNYLERLQSVVMATGPRASILPQPALADFIRTGEFAKHIRKMRRLYAKRQACLVECLNARLSDVVDAKLDSSGMHLVCPLVSRLQGREAENQIVTAAQTAGLVATPIARYAIDAGHHRGLVLGYAAFTEDEIRAAVEQLDSVIPKNLRKGRRRGNAGRSRRRKNKHPVKR